MNRQMSKFYRGSFALPAFLFYFVFFLLPGIAGGILSFTDWHIDRLLAPVFVGLENYISIFRSAELKVALSNTVLFAVMTVVLKNVLGLLFAVLVTSRLVRFKNYYRIVLFFPYIMSFVVIGLLFSSLYHPSGILNSLLGFASNGVLKVDWLGNRSMAMVSVALMDVWQSMGFHMIIYIAGLMSIPKDCYEAARIDGAGSLQVFGRITLPLIMSTFNMNFILSVITGLKVFTQVYVLTNGGPGNATQVISTMGYKLFGEGRLGFSSAYNVLLTAIITVLCLLFLRVLQRREVEL